MSFIDTFQTRKLVLLVDDLGDVFRAALVKPAQNTSSNELNSFLSWSHGLVCVVLSSSRAHAFHINPMNKPLLTSYSALERNALELTYSEEFLQQFSMHESVEAREGVTTGISAADRAHTVSILGEEIPLPRKLIRPGHVFPIVAKEGGVLVKNGLPEAALDIVSMAGFQEAALFMDILDKQGGFLSRQGIEKLSRDHKIPIYSLSELIRFRLENETLVTKVAEANFPSHYGGEMRSILFKSHLHSSDHLALVKGGINATDPILTRVQRESTFSDVFGGPGFPSRLQLHTALGAIQHNGSGILVYLRTPAVGQLRNQVARGIEPFSHKPASMMREYGIGAQILRALGVRKVELLTGTKKNLVGLKTFGIEIVSQRLLSL